MNDEAIVAVFDTSGDAEAAIRDLAGVVPTSAISRHDAQTRDVSPPAREPGFWSSLFGGEPEYDTKLYDRSVERGSIVVTVKATGAQASRVTEILERHNPIDLNERAASFGLATPAGAARRDKTASRTATGVGAGEVPAVGLATDATAAADIPPGTRPLGAPETRTEGDRLELAEETLSVGKRLVNRGTTRVRRFVVETPVEEQVTLHDERVSVQRRPVSAGRTGGTPDFSEKSVEMTETAEEPVVSKTARVKEEVVLSKEATERVETVRDTVRSEDVKVETVPGAAPASRGKTPERPAAGGVPPV